MNQLGSMSSSFASQECLQISSRRQLRTYPCVEWAELCDSPRGFVWAIWCSTGGAVKRKGVC